MGGGGGHHGAFPSPSTEASASVHMNPLSLKLSHFYESQRERNGRLREGKAGVSGQRSHLAPPLVLPRVLATTYQLSGSKLQGVSNYPAFPNSGPVSQFSTPSGPSGSWGGEQSTPCGHREMGFPGTPPLTTVGWGELPRRRCFLSG